MTIETLPRPESAERNLIPIFDASEVMRVCEATLERARQLLTRLESVPLEQAGVETILDVWDDTAIVLEDAFGAFMARRYERCRFIVEGSEAIGAWEQDHSYPIDPSAKRFEVTMAAVAPL